MTIICISILIPIFSVDILKTEEFGTHQTMQRYITEYGALQSSNLRMLAAGPSETLPIYQIGHHHISE
jgi:hypothetical protein